jgi:hypothetical protein
MAAIAENYSKAMATSCGVMASVAGEEMAYGVFFSASASGAISGSGVSGGEIPYLFEAKERNTSRQLMYISLYRNGMAAKILIYSAISI